MTKIYHYEIDLNRDTTHNRSIRLIGHGKRVLEFGCATGYVSKILTEQYDCTVTGIESNPDAVAEAQTYCHRVICGDAESLDYATELNSERFDVILFGDVLEHFKDPWTVLRKSKDFLDSNGYVVASIPNIAHASVALELLSGRFNYEAEGLLDETHLRFFTRRSIQELFESTGYLIAELSRIKMELSATKLASLPGEIVEFALRHDEALTYQFVVKAYPTTEAQALKGLRMNLAEREAAVSQLRQDLESTRGALAQREAALGQLRRDFESTGDALATARASLQAVVTSKSWRITAPLRWFKAVTATAIDRPTHGRKVFALHDGIRSRMIQGGTRRSASGLSKSSTEAPTVAELSLPAPPSTPLVSIIIPVYNQIALTLRCLKSIQNNPSIASAEIIVVDDASQDETAKILPSLVGIRYIRNHTNLGFLRSCNRAAAEARGDYLVFLNNDTEVQADWLDHMLAVFEHHENVGIVGAKLIYPDGRLQEVGGLVWSDGSAMNFGRDDDPRRPEYCYVRETDYCSAACLLITASLFHSVKGFDELFEPAYYEDVDLAFKVRAQGYRVLCQPAAQILHKEGASCGTDLSTGVKSYQQINEKKFATKWGPRLKDYSSPAGERDLFLARDRRATGRCLFVDVWPAVDIDAGSIYTVYLVKLFQRLSYKVTFFPANTTQHYGKYTDELQQMGVECLYDPFVTNLREYLERDGHYFDVVVLSRADQATRYFDEIRRLCPKARIIFHTVDLHFLREERAATLKNSAEGIKTVQELKRAELEVCKMASATLVPSTAEASLLQTEVPDAYVECFPFALSLPGRKKAFGDRRDIAFIAGYLFEPNVDAVTYFVKEIWPHIAERLPDIQFLMVGSNMPESVARLAGNRVKAIGYVKDLTQFLENCRLTVAPIRYGAGIKGKIVSSLTHGVPVVATSLAAEGMGCEHGVHLLVADTIAEWTDAVTRAYRDESVWEHLSDNGVSLMRDSYSLDAGLPRLGALLHRLDRPLPTRWEESKQVLRTSSSRVQTGEDQGSPSSAETDKVKLIAFYLPQYHPIPENDKWWGKGFTEWTNVTRARALFPGHFQPHLPSELGFYDLRVEEVREAQAGLARQYGIHGFCYYYYWFGGKRLLDRPLSEMLASGRPDFPFCLCWANEDWTRRWDGLEKEILLKQEYAPEGDRNFIHELFPILADRRYIRVEGKPLLLVYRTESLPNAKRTAETWREASVRAGVGDLYLCRVESFSSIDPEDIGFDAACQFPPLLIPTPELDPLQVFDGVDASAFKGKIFDYRDLPQVALSFDGQYKRFFGVTPSWDNTPRRGNSAFMWLNNSPATYEDWLVQAIRKTHLFHHPNERLLFINAWNEWGEGCHLEPDQSHGRDFLEATRRALDLTAGHLARNRD